MPENKTTYAGLSAFKNKDTDNKHPSSTFTCLSHKLHLSEKRTKRYSENCAVLFFGLVNVTRFHELYRVINQEREVLVQDGSGDVVAIGEGPEDLIG